MVSAMGPIKYVDRPVITYVGWNDRINGVVADFNLGVGVRCKHGHGIRRAVWDAAFGYVNGFRKRDILYFVLTRSLSKRVWKLVLARNNRRGDNDHVFSSLTLDMKQHCLETGNSY